MPPLQPDEVKKVIDSMPPALLEAIENLEGGFIIAGGAVRDALLGDVAKDIDIWPMPLHGSTAPLQIWADGDYQWEDHPGDWAGSGRGGRKFRPREKEADRALPEAYRAGTLIPLDFVEQVFPSGGQCISGFDFTCNQGAITFSPGEGWEGICGKGFRPALEGKVLEKVALKAPLNARYERVKRFLDAGWKPGESLKAKVEEWEAATVSLQARKARAMEAFFHPFLHRQREQERARAQDQERADQVRNLVRNFYDWV